MFRRTYGSSSLDQVVASPPRRYPSRFCSNSLEPRAPANSDEGPRVGEGCGDGDRERRRRDEANIGGRGRRGPFEGWRSRSNRGGSQRSQSEASLRRYRPTATHRRRNEREGEGGGRGGRRDGETSEASSRVNAGRQANSRTTPRIPRRSGTRVSFRMDDSSRNNLRALFNSSSELSDVDVLELGDEEAVTYDELRRELRQSRGGLNSDVALGLLSLMQLSSVGDSPRRQNVRSTVSSQTREGHSGSGDRGRGQGSRSGTQAENASNHSAPRVRTRSDAMSARSNSNRINHRTGPSSARRGSSHSQREERRRQQQRIDRDPPRSESSSLQNSSSNSTRSTDFRTSSAERRVSSQGARSSHSNRRNRDRLHVVVQESSRDAPQPQRRRQLRVTRNVLRLPDSLRSFLLYGIDDLWPEEFDQEFFGDHSELQNGGFNFLSTSFSSINNLPPTPRVAEGENCQREKLKDELNSNTAECVICTDLLGATEQVWPCQNCYNIFHLYCIRRWAKTNLDSEIGGAWICPVCRRPKYITPNRLRYRCLCGRLPKPKSVDGVTPHCCGKRCIRKCSHLCHPGPCRPQSPREDQSAESSAVATDTTTTSS